MRNQQQDMMNRYATTRAKEEKKHEQQMKLYDAIEYLNLGEYFKDINTIGHRVDGSIIFERVPTKEEVIRLYKLLPPIEPFIMYKSGCTSFAPLKLLKLSEQENEEAQTIIHPFTAKVSYNYMHDPWGPWELKFGWFTRLPNGMVVHVDVKCSYEYWHKAVNVNQQRRETRWSNSRNRQYETVWSIGHVFGASFKTVRWATSSEHMPDYTIYFVCPEDDVESILDPVVNSGQEDNDVLG